MQLLSEAHLRYENEALCVVFKDNSDYGYMVGIRYPGGECKCHALDYHPSRLGYTFLGKKFENVEDFFEALNKNFQDLGTRQHPILAFLMSSDNTGIKTFDKDGQVVSDKTSGHARMRIHFFRGDQFDVNIAGQPEEIKPGDYISNDYDPITDTASVLIREFREGKIYKIRVQVQDMADRLLITKEKIIKYALNGQLDYFLNYKENKLPQFASAFKGLPRSR